MAGKLCESILSNCLGIWVSDEAIDLRSVLVFKSYSKHDLCWGIEGRCPCQDFYRAPAFLYQITCLRPYSHRQHVYIDRFLVLPSRWLSSSCWHFDHDPTSKICRRCQQWSVDPKVGCIGGITSSITSLQRDIHKPSICRRWKLPIRMTHGHDLSVPLLANYSRTSSVLTDNKWRYATVTPTK